MWKRIVAPTIVICVLWIAISFLSMYYVERIIDSHARSLSEDFTTIDSSWRIREDIRKIQTLLAEPANQPFDGIRQELVSLERSIDQEIDDVWATSFTEAEQLVAKKIRHLFAEYKSLARETLRRDLNTKPFTNAEVNVINELLLNIRAECHTIAEIKENLIRQASDRRSQLQTNLTFFRIGFLVAVPVLGLLYGLYVARKINRELMRIRIVLNDTTGQLGYDLGTVELAAADDLPELHKQVQIIGDRVQFMLSELKDVRLRALKSERLAAVGELAAGVAHEIRNPLTSVKLLIQNASQRQNASVMNAKCLDVVLCEILRMEEIVQGLLDFSKPMGLTRVRHDLRKPIQQALNLVQGRAERKQIGINVQLGDVPLDSDGDATQLQSAFTNLIINAIDVMGEDGTLEIIASSRDGTARITFADSGPGISPEIIGRIFEPFVTNKDRGTGLGLAISQRIVREHGGILTAANRPEGGAIFTVALQLAPAKSHETPVKLNGSDFNLSVKPELRPV